MFLMMSFAEFEEIKFKSSHRIICDSSSYTEPKLTCSKRTKSFCEYFAHPSAIYPKIIPAMVADNKEASEPPKTAFMPNEESTLRWPGAKDPIPPI